jgi:hypothetical protein
MIPFPDKKYNIIYADPAWNYTDKSLNRGGAARHYLYKILLMIIAYYLCG